jgi:flagellar basal body-associated protein FliL
MARKKAEEQEPEEGTWSGLRKTIIGTVTTLIAGGGVWLSTILFGGGEEPKEETKTEQSAPAQGAPVIVNVQQNQENKQKVENGGNTVIRERVIEKPAAQTQQPAAPVKKEEDSW